MEKIISDVAMSVEQCRWPHVGVLVLNYNGRRWLSGVFQSLADDGYSNKTVFLVDNASKDDSTEFVKNQFAEVEILQMSGNLGYSQAYNVAIKYALKARCKWIVLLNNDTLVERGWLNRIISVGQSDADIGVLGPVFRAWAGEGPSDFMRARYPEIVRCMHDVTAGPCDVDWVEGSALAMSASCFESVGHLDPDLFMYWEDADFCRRARRKNWRVVLVPGSVIKHFGGGTAHQGTFNRLKARNEYVYAFCDPGNLLIVSIWNCGKLFMVNMRMALRSERIFAQTRNVLLALSDFASNLPRWLRKRRRDLKGESPPALVDKACENERRV